MAQHDVASNNYGLVFSISPAKIQKIKSEEDEEYVLTLAPFTKAPKINFGQVKMETTVERNLLIINPQQFEVKLTVKNQELAIDNMELTIDKMTNVNFKIKWQPEKPGNYKYAILFEVTNNARLKFLVHAFGVCPEPVKKKPIRKPFTTLQPLKKEKSAVFTEPAPKTTIPTVTLKNNKLVVAKKENKVTPKRPTIQAVISKASGPKTTVPQPCTIPASKSMLNIDKTFLVEQTKPLKAPSLYDIYSKSPEFDLNKEKISIDLRRQTTIVSSPRINNEGKYITQNELLAVRRSFSTNTLDTSQNNCSFIDSTLVVVACNGESSQKALNQVDASEQIDSTYLSSSRNNPGSLPRVSSTCRKVSPIFLPKHDMEKKEDFIEDKTPKFTDYIKPVCTHLTVPASLATQLNYDNEPLIAKKVDNCSDERLLKFVLMCQRAWRLKRFRRCLRTLKFERTQAHIIAALANSRKKHEELERHRLLQVVKMQRCYRMKRFRQSLGRLRYQHYQEKLNDAALICQRLWRLKKFRRALYRLKQAAYTARLINSVLACQHLWRLKKWRQIRQQQQLAAYNLKLTAAVLTCQRIIRIKRFRRHLLQLKQARLLWAVQVCQKAYRMRRFRQCLKKLVQERDLAITQAEEARINTAAKCIQMSWRMYRFRCQMSVYKKAAHVIQHWFKVQMRQRREYLQIRRATCLLQRVYRARFNLRQSSALKIQKTWRMHLQRVKYRQTLAVVVRLQCWIRSKSDRLKFLALKRSVSLIQQVARAYLKKRSVAVTKIQRQCRLFLFRRRMSRFRNAALLIQHWHHSMQPRYQYLRQRLIICKIQRLYRNVYMVRRHSAALRIQTVWRMYAAKKITSLKRVEWTEKAAARLELRRLNSHATRIQAWWRGYSVRKQTNQIINSIRNRLSIYVQSGSTLEKTTLGARIRNSINILVFQSVSTQLSIQQIIIALIDLEKVTRLSPECCIQYTREGAPEILYNFISKCNRSVPHMDLVQFCLQIFVNLAKYSETVCEVLAPSLSLTILVGLFQAYHSSNPVIFMDLCVLFILLSQSPLLAEHLLNQESFVKKLQNTYSLLERRTAYKQKNSTVNVSSSINNMNALNNSIVIQNSSAKSSLCTTPLMSVQKKNVSVMFSLTPEWSLCKKQLIELADPLAALQYLLDTLGIKVEKEFSTPVKSKPNSLFREVMSSSKSSIALSKQHYKSIGSAEPSNRVKNSMIKSQSANFKPTESYLVRQQVLRSEKTIRASIVRSEICENIFELQADLIDENMSMCIADTTLKSMASFIDEPKLNSTTIFTSKHTPSRIPTIAAKNMSASKHASSQAKPELTKKKINLN